MKIVEALKKIKDLKQKIADLQKLVWMHCAHQDVLEKPVYEDAATRVPGWIQSISDMTKEISSLKIRIQKTNLATNVTILLGEVQVTKTIAEWIVRRQELALIDYATWNGLSDCGKKAVQYKDREDGELRIANVKRYYSPAERDTKVALYKSEPTTINSALEVVNASTDLVD